MKSIVVSVPQSGFVYRERAYSPVRSNVSYFFKRYGLIAFFITVLFVGMIFGAIQAGTADSELIDKLNLILTDNVFVKGQDTAAGKFINSFGTSFMFLMVMFVLSLSPFGVAAVPAVIFFRGFGYGVSSGFLCITYGFKGLIYYIFVMLIGAFISSLALIYVSQYCFDFSRNLCCAIFCRASKYSVSMRERLSSLLMSIGYMLLLIIFASLVDTGLYYLIGGLFSF